MIVYRLMQDWNNLLEGACISEAKYKALYYRDRCLYEPIIEEEMEDWIEHKDEEYCINHGIECILFYTPLERMQFLNKIQNVSLHN